MKFQFRHIFSSRHPVVATFQGAKKPPKIQWPKGFPPQEVLWSEYPAWIISVFQTAANRYKSRILYYMPTIDGIVFVKFEPEMSIGEQGQPANTHLPDECSGTGGSK
jgi:hypothetical protein